MTESDYLVMLAANNVRLKDLKTYEEAIMLERQMFTFSREPLSEESKLYYEITSIKRRMLDFMLENTDVNKIRMAQDKLAIVYRLMEEQNYEDAKLWLVHLSSYLGFTTKFQTTLYRVKKYFLDNGIKYYQDPLFTNFEDYELTVDYPDYPDDPFGPKKKGKK